MPKRLLHKFAILIAALMALTAMVPAVASAAPPEELPDPMDRGPYDVQRLDPFKAGPFSYQEPHSNGSAPSGATSLATFQIRGDLYLPVGKPGKSPLIVLVHGNHGSCDSGSAPNCTVFKRNDAGYAYLGENLASWGYAVASLDQDQLMSRQDGQGKGMHARRLLISSLLESFEAASEAPIPGSEDNNLGNLLVDKLDMTRIGMMGHSRGGDAVSSFIDWNRMKPTGKRYPLRGVISLAPVDYERHAPYGTPYMAILPWCDGDVSNLQGARFYERSQYIDPDNPYPTIQSSQLGANHNWYNTVWYADGEDGGSGSDAACRLTQANNSRLSGQAGAGITENYVIDNSEKLNPLVNTRISGDPKRMGDQEKIGLATMAAFFRRYVGGEGAFEPYMTGELNEAGAPQIPPTACPTSESGIRMPCIERVSNSYFAPAGERLDVIVPDTRKPLAVNALGAPISAAGFANPFVAGGGVSPLPPTTGSGLDWCNPEPEHTTQSTMGLSGRPTAKRPCPLPADGAVGGQAGVRENAPVNHSYGRQLAIAWEDGGEPARLSTTIPAAYADVSGFKSLAMGADVNYFDPRNPAREDGDPETPDEALWNPAATTQDFAITLTDAEGNSATVAAADQRYGNALHQTTGNSSARVHIVLDQIRVPLEDFEGVDLTQVRKLELEFGAAGMPQSGSIQLADIRFQESTGASGVLVDSMEVDAGPGEGPPQSGPDPTVEVEEFDRSPASMQLPDLDAAPSNSVWLVDDDRAQCPDAPFSSIQTAVEQAAPWDTVVVCAGLYVESSTPIASTVSPAQEGSTNGLTITKPLKIKGVGADKVTIRAAAPPNGSLAGTEPFLRDGGGNVITVSRQTFGSTDDVELFVDISGVTVESPTAYAEAGIAFFNSAGRVANSVVGPILRAKNSTVLANRPHGWGIVATNHQQGAGAGTVLRRVSVDRTLVQGYQSGGILFDAAKGADGSELTTKGSGIMIRGYVNDSVVKGSGGSTLIPQTGIRYHAGATGFVAKSAITDNLFTPDQRKSAGILLTEAGLGGWYVEDSLIAGNGFGLFNADIADAAIREAAPATALANFWGTTGAPLEGPSALGTEGVSGKDTLDDPSVLFGGVLGSAPTPAGPGAVADVAPTGAIVDPADAAEVTAGTTIRPVVRAYDDYGIAAVELKVDGEVLATLTESPYAFEWTPGADLAGETATLTATITDSSGQTSSDEIELGVKAAPVPPGPQPEPTPESPAPSPAPGTPEPGPAAVVKPPAFGKVARDPAKGTLRLTVRVPAAGKVAISGNGAKTVIRRVKAGGSSQFVIRATGKKLESLNRDGKVTVKVIVTFTAQDGTVTRKAKTVTLFKK